MNAIHSAVRARPWGFGLAALALSTAVVLAGCLRNGFVNWDDVIFLQPGSAVLRFDVAQMAREVVLANYHPITLLSLALDHRLFGLDPFSFHLTNLVLHVVNTLLVVAFVRRVGAPGDAFVPFLCGALFAVHPLHVESVAWVAARKDLLSTAFYLLTLLAHLEFRRSGRAGWYAAALLAFVLALLSKPMAVTAPLVMLAIDWRLGRRLELSGIAPFLALALVAGVANVASQIPPDADRFAVYDGGPLSRMQIALKSLVFYVSKAFAPLRLSAYYDIDRVRVAPHQLGVALAAVAAAVGVCMRWPALRREMGFGALFFGLTVAPVLKLIPFGGNSLFNDRYMYLPSIGLFLMCALPFRDAFAKGAFARRAVLAGWGAAVIALSVQSAVRVGVWHDSGTLWRDVLEKVPGTPVALNNLGRYYLDDQGDLERASESFEAAVRERPEFGTAYLNLGVVYQRRGDTERAARAYERAVEIEPGDVQARIGAGLFYLETGDLERAVAHLEAAATLGSGSALAFYNLGVAHTRAGRLALAEEAQRHALDLRPDFAEAWAALGDLYRAEKRQREALVCYERAVALGYDLPPERLRRMRERAQR